VKNEVVEDVAETSPNQQRREGKQHVYYALFAVIYKKKTLREVEDEVAKQYSASSEKQTQNFIVLDHQDVEVVSLVNEPSFMSMVFNQHWLSSS
jgi:hypothetical protein